jgi:two-component system, chemotaxis family, chemotaxis protein CheY
MDFSEPESNTTPSERSLAERNLRALVVEDFEIMRRNVVATLETLNMQITEAVNGLDALKVLDENKDIDLVFTDLVMPEMDGFELSEEIRRRTDLRHLPIIVISTHRDAKYVIQALRRGADDYLTKPFTAPLAQRVVERALSHA